MHQADALPMQEPRTEKPRKHDVSEAFTIEAMVERKGIEPSTFAMRTRRSPS